MNIFRVDGIGRRQLTARDVLRDPLLLVAFGGGAGLFRHAPGTWGTLAALPLYALLIQFPTWGYLLATLVALVAGVYVCGAAARKLDEHDHSGIVWDEIAGLLLTLAFFDFSWATLLGGFVLFRVFDIVKPWPIRWLDQHVRGGLGIMLDDVAAALAAALVWGLLVTALPDAHAQPIEDTTLDVPKTPSTAQTIRAKKAAAPPADAEQYAVQSAQKMGEGLLDIATSWLEIPKAIIATTQKDGIAMGLTTGLAKGVANTASQAVGGAVNAASFAAPHKTVDLPKFATPPNDIAKSLDMRERFGAAFDTPQQNDPAH